ncbi:MAG: hypothetical protein IV094_13790 [Vitreoscilla sp.]|nr:hypothetical protein [Vitreoscilla sp.]
MPITYATEFSCVELRQGDVLRRTAELDAVLAAVHPHYNDRKYQCFMVLTQSCDLAIHPPATTCKSRYITVAPVRPLDVAVARFLKQQASARVRAELPVYSDKAKTKAAEFLHRVFNNNETAYFYLDSENTELEADSVACLNLSVALRASEHYGACLAAKFLELTETFQAKLGWLVGQMYSRVGTKDMEPAVVRAKAKATLDGVAVFVPDKKIAVIEAAYDEASRTNPDVSLSVREIEQAVKRAPSLRQQVIGQAQAVLAAAGLDAELVRKRLEADAGLQALLRDK